VQYDGGWSLIRSALEFFFLAYHLIPPAIICPARSPTPSGTHAGHMILQFGSQIGNWNVDITPLDSTLREHIRSVADDPDLNGNHGIQTLTFMVGDDSLSITAMQLAGAEGQQFFWQRERK
jgi:hypothetical protein